MSVPVPHRCLVPLDAIGLIVGRGGANVRQISKESGAEINVSGEGDTPLSLSDRIVTVCGDAAQKEAAWRHIVEKLYQVQEVEDGQQGIFVVLVPLRSADFVLGPEGATLRAIADETGADINAESEVIGDTQEIPVRIMGSLEQTMAAAARLGGLLQEFADEGIDVNEDGSLDLAEVDLVVSPPKTEEVVRGQTVQLSSSQSNSGFTLAPTASDGGSRIWSRGGTCRVAGLEPAELADRETQEVPYRCLAPVDAVGLIVGRGGASVRKIFKETGAEVRVSNDTDTPASLSDRVIEIHGDARQKSNACRQIVQKLYRFQEVADGEEGIFVMLVPAASSSYISRPEALHAAITADAAIVVEDEIIEDTDERPVRITGSLEQSSAAAAQIGELLQELADTGVLQGVPDGILRPSLPRPPAEELTNAGLSQGVPGGIFRGPSRPAGEEMTSTGLLRSAPTGTLRGPPSRQPAEALANAGLLQSLPTGALRGPPSRMRTSMSSTSLSSVASSVTRPSRSAAADAPPAALIASQVPGRTAPTRKVRVWGSAASRRSTNGTPTSLSNGAVNGQAPAAAKQMREPLVEQIVPSAAPVPGAARVSAHAAGRAGFNASGSPAAAETLGLQSPSEAALVKALLVDSNEESEVELSLLFPRDVIRRVLVPKGRLQAVAKRSGSRVKLGTDKASTSQLVTFTGSRLGNSMAVLYLQELLIEHGAAG